MDKRLSRAMTLKPSPFPPAFWGLIFFGLGLVLVLVFQVARVARQADVSGFQRGDPLPVFAVLFLLTAAIERVVEMLNRAEISIWSRLWQPFGQVYVIRGIRKAGQDREGSGKEAEAIVKDWEKRKRTVSNWGLASLIGMVLSYFTVGFFDLLGMRFSVPGVLEPQALDAIVTGSVIGSGTKPFHDAVIFLDEHRKREEKHEGQGAHDGDEHGEEHPELD